MSTRSDELVGIVTKFAESGWDLIDVPSTAWLDSARDGEASEDATANLAAAVRKADEECGSCGCEFDPLYKRALQLLTA